MILLDITGHSPPLVFRGGPIVGWMDMTITLAVTVTAMHLSIRSLNEALTRTRQQLAERKKAETALRESEERYARMSLAAFEGIGIAEQGRILDSNPQLAEMMGYESGELAGMEVMNLVAPESRELVAANIRAGAEGPYEHTALRKDGTTFPVVVRARSIPYQGRMVRVSVIRDLTERKRAEEALRDSEEKFRRLFETSRDFVFISDAEGKILSVNPAAEIMSGYSAAELRRLSLRDLFYDPGQLEALREEILGRGYFENVEVRGRRKDGMAMDGLTSATLIKDKKGNPAGFQGSIKDITERKQAEENIARQVERLRALHTIEWAITGSMDLKTILDLLAREVVEQLHMDAVSVLLLNEEEQTLDFAAGAGFRTNALRFTKLKVGAGLAGRAAQKQSIVHIPDLSDIHDNPTLAGSIAGENFSTYFGVPLVTKGRLCGVLEIFQRSASSLDADWPTFLETLAGQAATAIENARMLDMTRAHLKETEALYRVNRELVASTDPLELMKDIVGLLQENFGYDYVQIYVRESETGDFILRAGSGEIGEELIRRGHRLRAGEGIVGYTAETGTPFLTNDVEKVIIFQPNPLLPEVKSELAVPIKVGGQFLGLLDVQQAPPSTLTLRDLQLVSAVADQLAVALQKARLYADLQNSLRHEKDTRAQLIHSEKLAVAGRLMASVSHELNNPLQAIQNVLFLLKDEKRMSKQAKKDLGVILAEAERMAGMLDRLRTTYQPVRAEDFRLVRLNELIQDVQTLVSTHLRHAGISVQWRPDPALPSVLGVSDQLRQVILNLFMNAVDAMAGGGVLTVSTHVLADTGEVLVAISDTGEGIDPALLPNIFEPFVSGKEKGTGLGLTICAEIISNHNGRIQAENNPDRGAAFRVWLPAAKEGGA